MYSFSTYTLLGFAFPISLIEYLLITAMNITRFKGKGTFIDAPPIL